MRNAATLLACLLVVSVAGCSGDDDGPKSDEDCSRTEDFNAHERRCVVAIEPDQEVCNAWLNGDAENDLDPITCTAQSDGTAWLDSTLNGSSGYQVTVRDGTGRTVYEREVQFGGSVELRGTAGTWTLHVDFQDVSGSGRIVLWG